MMKKIKIAEENINRIAEILNEVQKRSRVRCVTPQEIIDTCNNVFRELNITKKALEGCMFTADLNAQDFPSAYKYTPESTLFTAVYKRGSWYLSSVRRDTTRRASQKVKMMLTDSAKTALLSKYECLRF